MNQEPATEAEQKQAETMDSPSSARLAGLVPLLFFLLAALAYSPLLLGLSTFPAGDFTHHFLPFSLFQHQALASGTLPIWNPYTYSGHPFLADVQAAVYYPISNFLLLLTLPIEGGMGRLYLLQVEAILHIALGGWFIYLWAHRLTGDRWAGLLAGVLFAFSGYLSGYAPLQLAVLRTAVWLPLLWWFLLLAWKTPTRAQGWLGAALVTSIMVVAGHSQTLLLAGYASVGWVIALCIGLHVTLRHVAGLFAVTVLTVGLTAAQWWPSWEFVQLSVRAETGYAFVSGGFAPRDYWQILLPRVLTQYSPVYIGVIGLVLVVLALFIFVARPRTAPSILQQGALPWRVGIGFLLTLVVVAALVSLGANGPLFPLLYRFAPGWSWFRGQERAAYLVTIGLVGLATYGLALAQELTLGPRRRGALLGGALVVGGSYAFALLMQMMGRTAVGNGAYLLISGATMGLGLAAALALWLPVWSKRRMRLLIALAAVNLVWANVATNLTSTTLAERVKSSPELVALTEAVQNQDVDPELVTGRVYNEYRLYDDYGMTSGIEDVWGSSPLRSARYAALFDQFPLDRMWQLTAVSHVLTWRRELFGPSELLGEFPQAEDTTYLHRLPDPSARAWFVAEVLGADDETTLSMLADHDVDLAQIALVPLESIYAEATLENQADTTPGSARDGQQNEATIETRRVSNSRVTNNRLVYEVSSQVGGLLVLSEVWFPGWHVLDARCGDIACPQNDEDGRPFFQPERTNLTLVGVWLPPGEVTFSLQYLPNSVVYGGWISVGTLVLVLLTGLFGWVQTRRRRQ